MGTLYKFRLRTGEILELTSKFSYDEILKIWREHGGKVGRDGFVAWGFKFKESDEEWNKGVMIMSMLLTFKSDKTMGTGNSELDKNLNHDFVLISLARLVNSTEKGSKERTEALTAIKIRIDRYKLPENERGAFQRILDSM